MSALPASEEWIPAPLFAQETTLEQQLDNPCAGRFRAEAVGGAEDLLQIFILHEAGNPGHRRHSSVASVKWRGGWV